MLGYERELLGFYVSGHPLSEVADVIQKFGLATTAQLADLAERTPTRVGGLMAEVEQRVSKQTQKPWAIVKLEDLQGMVEVLVYPDTFDKYRQHIAKGKVVFVNGTVKQEDKPKLTANEILPLEVAQAELTKEVHVRLATATADPKKLERVSEILAAHPGKVPVLFCFMTAGGEQVFMDTHDHFNVRPDKQLIHELEELLGEGAVYLRVDKTVRIPQRSFNGKRG
jgi:DNA polymerase-3 subunit alpha